MKKYQILFMSLLVSMAVYFTLTWPLGANFHEGIPSSNRPELGGARYMIPGDPLQFLYQLWMLADSFTGETPLFYHVYEFNQGDDQALYNPGSYYFPFGLVYAAGYALGGRVIGWNLMLCLTVWLIYWATWLLIRRFTTSWLTAGVAALPSIMLPYFHVSLLGGSPTGMGMLWVPLIFLGVDVAIRDRKLWGGILAGILLFISSWVDLHVFFFVFLATPVWALMCLVFNRVTASGASPLGTLRRMAVFSPVVIGMIGAYLQTYLIKTSLDHTLQSEGRSIRESLGYALQWTGWFDTTLDNPHNIIYIGVWVGIVLVAGLLLLSGDTWRKKPGAGVRLGLFLMIGAAIGGIALLALGPNTPFDPEHRLWKALRALIPPYKMIRQPAKIFCLLTPFLGIALALAIDRLNRLSSRRAWAGLLAVLVVAGCSWDYGRRLDPTICLLDYEQGGYKAVAEDAAKSGRENRAMAIPLWPGDSHLNSITEYYSTLYRTKMLNGYSPSVSRDYFTNVFLRFEAINMGLISDDILDGLLGKKIGYLLLHEDLFPEKVSPFPVSQTLRELMNHPRLQFLARDKAVWAFRILEHPMARSTTGNQQPTTVLSAWQWQGSRIAVEGGYQLDARTLYPVEGLRYLILMKTDGIMEGSFGAGISNKTFSVAVGEPNPSWRWVELPVPELPSGRQTRVAPSFTGTTGSLEIGMVTLMAGAWKWLNPGDSMTLPASAFFRAGYSDLESGAVHLDADRVQADVVFYAPILPLLAGRYRVSLDYAATGTHFGTLSVLQSDGGNRVSVPVEPGREAALDYSLSRAGALRLEFRYGRAADMVVRAVKLERLD